MVSPSSLYKWPSRVNGITAGGARGKQRAQGRGDGRFSPVLSFLGSAPERGFYRTEGRGPVRPIGTLSEAASCAACAVAAHSFASSECTASGRPAAPASARSRSVRSRSSSASSAAIRDCASCSLRRFTAHAPPSVPNDTIVRKALCVPPSLQLSFACCAPATRSPRGSMPARAHRSNRCRAAHSGSIRNTCSDLPFLPPAFISATGLASCNMEEHAAALSFLRINVAAPVLGQRRGSDYAELRSPKPEVHSSLKCSRTRIVR